jgi:NADH-ubiquinone oxidoreductase chain 5
MYILILYLPFIGSLITGCLGYFLGKKGCSIISVLCMFLTFLYSCFIFYEIGLSQTICNVELFYWFNVGNFTFKWNLLFDSLTAIMLLVVVTVSLLVHIYSISYMWEDPHIARFLSYLSLFTLFMLFLVTANNFLQLFLGWEGVGVASYLLINFWFTRLQANKAALKAVIVNKIGDIGLAIAIGLIFYTVKSLDFSTFFALNYIIKDINISFFDFEITLISLICFFIFIGCVGKSAQIGLHTWLPDAMEGPTPVSALIHAATMVTAGVFVIIRVSPILEYSNNVLIIITLVGAFTSFFAASIGLVQNDLKKVIAYSTCSQLGYMVFICGLSSYSLSLFHLMNHAFFKALLFLSAGSIIHAMSDEQDMRRLGGLLKLIPFTYVMILIGSLALMGFPFLTGFYSKDVILEIAFINSYKFSGGFAYFLGILAAFFTAFYSFRLICLTFYVKINSFKKVVLNLHELDYIMAFCLSILAFGSIFIGYLFKDLFLGLGTTFWSNSIYLSPLNNLYVDAEFLPVYIKHLPFVFSMLGLMLAVFIYNRSSFFKYNYLLIVSNIYILSLYKFLLKKWYFDNIYNFFLVDVVFKFGYFNLKMIDRGIIELIGPLGILRSISNLMDFLNFLQNSNIYHYGLMFILSLFFTLLLINNFFLFLICIDLRLNLIFFIILLIISCLNDKLNIFSKNIKLFF